MATLIVDADNVDASDAGNYTAAQDPSTPLKTIGRGMRLVLPGDTLQVKYADAADTSNAFDHAVYAQVLDDSFGDDEIPHADNSAGDPILVSGVNVGGKAPKWLGYSATLLKNWHFENFQIGYDLGSGHEYLTNTTLIGPEDLEHTDIVYTGGGSNIVGFTGHNVWTTCHVTAKLRDLPNPNFLEGNGFRAITDNGGDIVAGPDDWVMWEDCTFDTVQGEDGVQLVLANGFGSAQIEGCAFGNIQQTGAAHTDAIQCTGCTTLIVRGNTFGDTGPVDSMLICSDGNVGDLTVENNLFVGSPTSGFSMQISGIVNWLIRHNTYVQSRFAGLRLYANGNLPDDYGGEIYNNLIDIFEVDIPITWDNTKQRRNVIGVGPAVSTDIDGFAEYGDSDDTHFELANTPTNSPGIDQAETSDLLLDRLGRSRKGSAPDCGCHESDPDVPVTANPRAPILVAFTPTGNSAAAAANVTATLFPKPGQELDAGTVDVSSMFVKDGANLTIPALLTLGELDGNGRQTVTLDLKESLDPVTEGDLFPLATYTVTLTDDIEDSEGSVFGGASWQFRVTGTGSPAIGSGTGPVIDPASFTMGGVPWPVGTTVKVYPRNALPPGAVAPSGPPVTSAVVSASSTVMFDELAEGVKYIAFAAGLTVQFMVPAPVFKTIRVS